MPRLLLIEDEIGAIAALKRMLARAGHDILVSTNLPDALSALEQEQPDAVLVAAGLQGESASSLVEAIRGVDVARPLIVMGDGLGCGEPFLAKPVEPGKLLELLREMLPQGLGTTEAAGVTSLAKPLLPSRGLTEPQGLPAPPRPKPEMPRQTPAPSIATGGLGPDLLRRRELVAKTLAEAQARRQAAEAARSGSGAQPAAPALTSRPPSPPAPPALRTPSTELLARTPTTAPPLVREDLPFLLASSEDPFAQTKKIPLPPQPERRPAAPVSIPAERTAAPPPAPATEIEPAPAVHPPAEPSLPALTPPEAAQAPHFPRAELDKVVPVHRAAPPESLDIPRAGTLDALEPAAVVLACHRARISGQLQLDQGLVQRVLFFDDGRLSGAASTSPDERLEALSYRRGLISREQQRQLRAETQIPTRRLALLMVERAYLKPAELFPLVQERVEEVIYEACGAFAGSYQILTEAVPDDERVALARSPLALVTEGIRRKYLMERLLAGLGGPATLLKPTRGPELSDYGLTARERRLAQSVDGLRNVEELLFESGNEPLPGLKILYALLLGRSIEVAMRGLPADASADVEAKIDLTRVAEKYEQVRSGNYFEVLGVSTSATAYEIEQSYDRLAREFQPGRFRDHRRPELAGQLDEIQRLLAEARDILVDEGLREEYRAHLRR